jgi:hypothetical protein
MAGQINFGVDFRIGTTATPTTVLADVFNVTPPKQTRDAVDMTTHGSPGGAMEFRADGVYDPGELTVEMHFEANSATDIACLAALSASANYFFRWTAKSSTGAVRTFTTQGIVTSYGQDAMPIKGKQTATMTVKLSGAVTQAAVV